MMYANKKRFNRDNMAKIFCPHCKKPVAIRTSDQVTSTTREVYTNCNYEHCLARPVFIISHSHDIQPPINNPEVNKALAKHYFESLSDKDKKELSKNVT